VTPYDSIGVDTEDDLRRVEEILQRSVRNTAVDRLTMLLSTDWFAGLWAVIGLKMEAEKEACLRKGCREIVREMISGTEEYWHIDFSDDRLAKTHLLLDSLMKKCGLDKHLVERIDWLIEEDQQWKLDENTRSLLVHITDSLALNHLGFMLESITSRGLGEFKPALDPTVEQALLRAWASYTTVEKMNFNDLCLNSQSEWDRYTRSLKPDLPESLSTSLTQELLVKIKFDLLSQIVERELIPLQKQGLLGWYAAIGKVLTGAPIAVPDL